MNLTKKDYPIDLSEGFLKDVYRKRTKLTNQEINDLLNEVPAEWSDERLVRFLRPPFKIKEPLTEEDIAGLVIVDDLIAMSNSVRGLWGYDWSYRDEQKLLIEIEEATLDMLSERKNLIGFVKKHNIPDKCFRVLYSEKLEYKEIYNAVKDFITEFDNSWLDFYLELRRMRDSEIFVMFELFETDIQGYFSANFLETIHKFEKQYPLHADMIAFASIDHIYFLIYHGYLDLARDLGVTPKEIKKFAEKVGKINQNIKAYIT